MADLFIAAGMAERVQDTGLTLIPATFISLASALPMLEVDGFIVRTKKRNGAALILQDLGFTDGGLGMLKPANPRIKTSTMGKLMSPELKVMFNASSRIGQLMQEEFPRVGTQIETLFRNFAHLTGKELLVEFSLPQTVIPKPQRPGQLRILVGAVPPGPPAKSVVKEKSEHEYPLESRCIVFDCPSLGIGNVAYDEAGIAVAQIVGDNLYLFAKLDRNAFFLFQAGIIRILQSYLLSAWEAYVHPKPSEVAASLDSDSLTDSSESWQATFKTAMQDEIAERSERVRKAELEYTEALHMLKEIRFIERGASSYQAENYESRAQVIEKWDRVLKHPLMDSIHAVQGGFHLATKELIIEHEGMRYRLGTFTIRLDFMGEFTIWSAYPLHSEDEPHPHISKDGVICFGNITLAIRERITMKRDFPGAMLMVLEWLAHGYEPASAVHKIEEWPLLETANE